MRIGIDVYPLARRNITGIGIYLYNLILHLERLDKENEYFLYAPRDFKIPFKNNRWHVRLLNIPSFIANIDTWWVLVGSSILPRRDNIDIFLSTYNFAPLLLPRSIKKVLIMHDLALYVCPQTNPIALNIIFKSIFKKSLFSADEVITISNITKDAIIKYFPDFKKNKINVVYYGGAGEKLKQYDKDEARKYIFHKFNIKDKYILTVTSLEWRKNVTGLLEAFWICKRRFKIPHKLLIVIGELRTKVRQVYRIHKKLSLDEEALFLGHTDIEGLGYLYSAADAFVFPSFYEGFGLPPLEAITCGIPVIASDIPIFREILDGAALYVNPANPEDIARGIYRILTEESLREELKKKGLARAASFSWQKTVEETLKIIKKI